MGVSGWGEGNLTTHPPPYLVSLNNTEMVKAVTLAFLSFCHNSRTSDDIDIKDGPVMKLDKRNKTR